jgi:hypothetical protein
MVSPPRVLLAVIGRDCHPWSGYCSGEEAGAADLVGVDARDGATLLIRRLIRGGLGIADSRGVRTLGCPRGRCPGRKPLARSLLLFHFQKARLSCSVRRALPHAARLLRRFVAPHTVCHSLDASEPLPG